MPPRCWLWQSFSNLRCDTGIDTRRIYSVVCGIRITESLPLKTSKHHRKCGMLSQLAKLFSRQNGKSCLPKDSMSRRGLFCSPDCSALFLISSHRSLTASKQAPPIKWWLTAWLRASPSLSATLFLTTGNDSCQLTLSISLVLISPSSTSSVILLISCFPGQAQLIWCTPVDSHLRPDFLI